MGVDARMLIRHKGHLSDSEIRRLSASLVSGFGRDFFFVKRTHESWCESRHAIMEVTEHHQDSPPLISEPGEQMLEVGISCPYYAPGYERGPWFILRSMAEFLEKSVPDSEIWYGGDSSGFEARLFGQVRRGEITRHFIERGHHGVDCRVCDFCGGRPLLEIGSGGGKTFLRCDGCEQEWILQDDKLYCLPEGTQGIDWQPSKTLAIEMETKR